MARPFTFKNYMLLILYYLCLCLVGVTKSQIILAHGVWLYRPVSIRRLCEDCEDSLKRAIFLVDRRPKGISGYSGAYDLLLSDRQTSGRYTDS